MDGIAKLANIIKKKSQKNKWGYRLVALCLGYSAAFVLGNVFRFNFDTSLLFAGIMLVSMGASKRLLKNMFLLDGAWNMLIDKGYDLAGIIGKTYKTANMGKRLAFLGSLLGGYSGIVMVTDNSGRVGYYTETFENVVLTGAVIVFTFWIPQLVLLINKFTAKRYATKNPDTAASYAEALYAESIGEVAKARHLIKVGHIPGAVATRAATMIVGISVIGNLYAALDVKGMIKTAIAEKEYATQMEEEAMLAEVEWTEIEEDEIAQEEAEMAQAEADTTGNSGETESMEEEKVGNPNGNGFYVTSDCLEAYLAYISSGTVAADYYSWQTKRFEDWERFEREPTHFAICGMHSGEPYLLLGAKRGGIGGDSILFAERKSSDPNTCYIATDWDIRTYGDLSNRQFLGADELYIYNGEKEKNAKFVLHRSMIYVETEMEEDMVNFFYYDTDFAGNINESKNSYNVKRGIWLGELLEIKWFDINDIDAARAYFAQYATSEEVTAAPATPAYNRADYYVPGSPLIYFDYIEEGEFTVNESHVEGYNPVTYYKFNNLPADFDWNKAVPHIEPSYIVRDGASATDYFHYIFVNEEGKMVCITVVEFHDSEEGCSLTISYETNEVFITNKYNMRYGTSCETLMDIVNDGNGR